MRTMMIPNILTDNLFDDFFGFATKGPKTEIQIPRLMATDIEETETGYEFIMNLPGYQKDDVKGELKDGYLTVTAECSAEDTTDKNGYIRKERYTGKCQRSFYVGKDLEKEDIKARFVDGTLRLSIPKKQPKQVTEEDRLIAIEG